MVRRVLLKTSFFFKLFVLCSMTFFFRNSFAEITNANLFGSATGFLKVPTSLSLSHSSRSKTFTVSWIAGSGNGGSNGCKLQFSNSSSVWTNLADVNCDTNGSASGTISLPGNGWYGSSWANVSVRLVRVSDSAVLGVLGTLTCSQVGGSASSTPNIDEDCNGNWDNTTSVQTNSACNASNYSNVNYACPSTGTSNSYLTAITCANGTYTTPNMGFGMMGPGGYSITTSSDTYFKNNYVCQVRFSSTFVSATYSSVTRTSADTGGYGCYITNCYTVTYTYY